MRLQVKGGFDPVLFELLLIVFVMVVLGSAIYYYGCLYGSRAEITHVMRYPSAF